MLALCAFRRLARALDGVRIQGENLAAARPLGCRARNLHHVGGVATFLPGRIMSRMPSGAVRVAIAEDNADARHALHALLTLLGHQVVCEVGDGAALLEHCASDQVDLVISDLDMPGIDGLEAAEMISKRGIPVILLSGHPDVEHVNVEAEPVAGRLRKPATAAALEDAIRSALGSNHKPR
jgi:CheY-like chemotaxis protein